jgi:hypothetical protein
MTPVMRLIRLLNQHAAYFSHCTKITQRLAPNAAQSGSARCASAQQSASRQPNVGVGRGYHSATPPKAIWHTICKARIDGRPYRPRIGPMTGRSHENALHARVHLRLFLFAENRS